MQDVSTIKTLLFLYFDTIINHLYKNVGDRKRMLREINTNRVVSDSKHSVMCRQMVILFLNKI